MRGRWPIWSSSCRLAKQDNPVPSKWRAGFFRARSGRRANTLQAGSWEQGQGIDPLWSSDRPRGKAVEQGGDSRG